MIFKGYGAVATIAAAVLVSGCQTNDETPATGPNSYSFEGKAEPKFVGTWVTADGNSTILLTKDGTMKITSVEHSVKGRTVSVVSGDWAANADSLLFRYASGAGQSVVTKYSDSLQGNLLVLQQPGLKIKTTYRRK